MAAAKHEKVANRDLDGATSSDAETASTISERPWRQRLQRFKCPLIAGAALLAVGSVGLVGTAFGGKHLAAKNMDSNKEFEGKFSKYQKNVFGNAVHNAVKDAIKDAAANVAGQAGKHAVAKIVGLPTQADLKRAGEEAVTGEELTEPEVLPAPGSRAGPGLPGSEVAEVEMTLEAVKLHTPWIGGYFWTRGYNGGVPGPTIRVKPGDTLKITLHNKLGPGPGLEACDFKYTDLGYFLNPHTICRLNSTNLHTHGLHVSSHEDSIFDEVKPGETHVITIKVPDDHMGGTHWYHPHLHHATAAQAGGGAHGALIVEDPPMSLPLQLHDMPEKLMFFSLVNPAKSIRLESWGTSSDNTSLKIEQKMWRNPAYPEWTWDLMNGVISEHGESLGMDFGIKPQLVVNGQYLPKVTMDEGKWYRFRMVFAAIEQRVELFAGPRKEDTSAFCQYQLIAKDGIYLHDAPRAMERIYLVSGSRADVAVSCNCGEAVRPCNAELHFSAKWEPMGIGNLAPTIAETTGPVLSFSVREPAKPDAMASLVNFMSPTARNAAPPIIPFSVRRPCYLADLRQVSVPKENKHTMDLPQLYPMYVKVDGHGDVWGHEKPAPLVTLPLGTIQEFYMTGIRYHPIHTHVVPFQITEIWNDPYYLPGDWHDTMLPTGSRDAVARFNMDSFAGDMIVHCHLLEHEDNGMMGYFKVDGVDGTKWTDAHQIDPQCYDGRFTTPPLPKLPPLFR